LSLRQPSKVAVFSGYSYLGLLPKSKVPGNKEVDIEIEDLGKASIILSFKAK
jgi:hypothetical protein